MITPLQNLFSFFRERHRTKIARTVNDLTARYHIFRSLLESHNQAVELLTELDIRLHSMEDLQEDRTNIYNLGDIVFDLVEKINYLDYNRHQGLFKVHQVIVARIKKELTSLPSLSQTPGCIALNTIKPWQFSAVGNKAAALAIQKQDKKFIVPDGFVITVQACRDFLKQHALFPQLASELHGYETAEEIPFEIIDNIKKTILETSLPSSIKNALKQYGDPFFETGRGLAVRSSSRLEDGSCHSFAGQFATVLNVVDQRGLQEAFRKVVASNFNYRSIMYRQKARLSLLDFDMAVLCMEMIPARSAGILLSKSIYPDHNGMIVTGVFGLGEAAVSGSSPADIFLLDKNGKIDHIRSVIAEKKYQLVCSKDGGVEKVPMDTKMCRRPILTEEELSKLIECGRILELKQHAPVDVEWAITPAGDLILIQVRPQILTVSQQSDGGRRLAVKSSVISASPGHTVGRIHLVKNRKDLEEMPEEPTILLLHQSLADVGKIIHRINGILVDLGNPADHLALVAREYGIPMLCNFKDATIKFRQGQWIRMDSDKLNVEEATGEEIELAMRPDVKEKKKTTASFDRMTQSVRDLLVPLNLTDADSPHFLSSKCRSLHDLIRYIHEKSVLAMFNAGDDAIEEGGIAIHIIDIDAPFLVNVIDLGGGLRDDEKLKQRISPGSVLCEPLLALVRGIETPGLSWGPPPGSVNIGSVVSNYIADQRSNRPVGLPNYAIISRDYLNLNARMDFHFTMIDTICGIASRSNYIKFRFKGGGTLPAQRQRRARCIGFILEEFGFFVDVNNDLVNGVIQGLEASDLKKEIVMLGRLLGFTRLLDAAMRNDGMIREVAAAFLEGDYQLERLVSKQE